MSHKQQQVHTTAAFHSKIPRFDPKLQNASLHLGKDVSYHHNTQLKKSSSHFNAKEPYEDNSQKRLSEPDILRSTTDKSFSDINVSWNPHHIGFKHDKSLITEKCESGKDEFKLKREELSLSHLPSVLSDMEDDNASLDSLGILTPNQMKDFLEDEVVTDSNIVEVIDINGHKIECKLHYEDMQWSSPFLHLSGGKNFDRNIESVDKIDSIPEDNSGPTSTLDLKSEKEISLKVSELLKAHTSQENNYDGGYTADNEADICINNQQIIEIIHKASTKQEKRILSIVPLSESGYNADNESDVLSDVSPSPTEEKYTLPEAETVNIQRESVTDSGFYSETRSSCLVGSESDIDEAPRLKTRSMRIIDGKLYCSNQNIAEQVEIAFSESTPNVIENNCSNSHDVAPCENVEFVPERTEVKDVESVELQIHPESDVDMEDNDDCSHNSSQACDDVKSNTKSESTAKSAKKPTVMSKLKHMLDSKSKEDIPGEIKQQRKSYAPKKSRWDSITAKIAASMADDKKVPKKEVRSKIDTKGQVVPVQSNKPKREVKPSNTNISNRTTKANLKSVAVLNKENLSTRSQPTEKISKRSTIPPKKQDSKLNLKENRPNSARSNHSDISKHASSGIQIKRAKPVPAKSNKSNERIKSPINSQGSTVLDSETNPDGKTVKESDEQKMTKMKQHQDSQLTKMKNSSKLLQEIDSLKIALDLKTEEMHALGKQKIEMIKELEDLSVNKEKVLKLTEKVEDLQEILNIKSDVERSLMMEQQSLKETIEAESKVNERLSTEIEELQSKLKQSEQKMIKMKQHQDSQLAKMKNSHKLLQEIDSLKVVLDLKSEEMHALRKQNMEMTKELEDLSANKEKVRKLTAKIEDLQEILSIKSGMERSLTIEHESLKQTVETESKVNKRLSMEIEELQWKLRQNDSSDCESLPLSPGLLRSHSRSSSKRSSTINYPEFSPKSPSRRAFTVSICQISPSKQTQTDLFNFPVTLDSKKPTDDSDRTDASVWTNETDANKSDSSCQINTLEMSSIHQNSQNIVSFSNEELVKCEIGKSIEVPSDVDSVAVENKISCGTLTEPAVTTEEADNQVDSIEVSVNRETLKCMQEENKSIEMTDSSANESSMQNSICEPISEGLELQITSQEKLNDVTCLDEPMAVDVSEVSIKESTSSDTPVETIVSNGNDSLNIDIQSNNANGSQTDSSDSSPDDSGTYSEPTVKSVVLVEIIKSLDEKIPIQSEQSRKLTNDCQQTQPVSTVISGCELRTSIKRFETLEYDHNCKDGSGPSRNEDKHSSISAEDVDTLPEVHETIGGGVLPIDNMASSWEDSESTSEDQLVNSSHVDAVALNQTSEQHFIDDSPEVMVVTPPSCHCNCYCSVIEPPHQPKL